MKTPPAPSASIAEFLKDYRDGLRASIDYFASKNKADRESWTCHEFLRNLGVHYTRAEVKQSAIDPPDAIFRSARFEIKEVLDAGRRRHAEYKTAYSRALAATTTDGLLKFFEPKDLTASDVLDKVTSVLEGYANHYPSQVRASLDLLVYVNLIEHFYKDTPFPVLPNLAKYGWRSISAVTGSQAFVFYASVGSPRFLALRRGIRTQRRR